MKRNIFKSIPKKIIILFFVFLISLSPFTNVNADLSRDISDLKASISSNNKKIQDLQAEKEKYANLIKLKQDESLSLTNELDILTNQILKVNITIEELALSIETVGEEISYLELSITEKEEKIVKEKKYLENLLREINFQDNIGDIDLLLMYDNFSDYFESVNTYNSLQQDLQSTVEDIQDEKSLLEMQKLELEDKKVQLEEDKLALRDEKERLQENLIVKEFYLNEVQNSEEKFKALLSTTKVNESKLDEGLRFLENDLRSTLEAKAEEDRKAKEVAANAGESVSKDSNLDFLNQDAVLRWPIPPNRGISAIFHDPSYPFRHLFEHSGIDIRAYQGTELKAAESGYVGKAKDNGMGYSYLLLIHADGISTLFGHVSKFYVKEGQYVTKGQVVALSGGMPGTPGAGRFSTGPHLHFEVRLNGIPVDPMLYLP